MSNCPICENRIPKNSPTSHNSTWSEMRGAWICEACATVEKDQVERGIIDTELNRHDPLWKVIQCMQLAIKELSDNEYAYADDDLSTNIHHEEISVIINHLKHGNEWSAIQYSDSFSS